jgi:hypothetical protein
LSITRQNLLKPLTLWLQTTKTNQLLPPRQATPLINYLENLHTISGLPKITPLTPFEMPSLMIELEIPTHSETLLPITPNLQASKKRFCISELVLPPKEGPGVPTECENLLETLPLISNHHVFSPGISEKSPTKTTFKATRKGKNKLVSSGFCY